MKALLVKTGMIACLSQALSLSPAVANETGCARKVATFTVLPFSQSTATYLRNVAKVVSCRKDRNVTADQWQNAAGHVYDYILNNRKTLAPEDIRLLQAAAARLRGAAMFPATAAAR